MELIVTHSHTDFDGLGAQLAAHKLFPHALPLLNNRLRDNVAAFVAQYREHLPFVREDELPDQPVSRLIVVDTPEAGALRMLGNQATPTLIIDHHPRSHPPRPHEELIYAEVGAATSMLVERLANAEVTLSVVEATLMLLGIYDDTGNLTYTSTRQQDVAAAAWLLGQGARLEALGEFLRHPLSAEQDRIFQQLDRSIQHIEIGGWNVLLASAQVDADAPQLSSLAEKLRDLYTPAVTALAISTGYHGTQIILRANSEALDVGELARSFGGGGHAAAAAAYVRDRSADALLLSLEQALRRDIRPARSAADIMSRPVVTAPLDATIAEVDVLLVQSGHNTLPVIDAVGALKGVITRRDVTNAIRYNRGDAPVTRYMCHSPPALAPTAARAMLHQHLVEADEKQLNCVVITDSQRRPIGMITPVDLLRARSGEPRNEQPLGAVLDQFLPPTLLALLKTAAVVAEERGMSLYVVGGTVRDMLLRRVAGDLDLLVEGDAIALAEALAEQWGSVMHSHAAFGTATLEIGGQTFANPTPDALTLDFITARREFYPAPAALPQVDAASLRDDLRRRDFTINTLAICLNPARYGQLYDFYGGRRDLQRQVIRVLHGLSFLDDPTRILRAARLAARLGFTVEPHTRALIEDALEYAIFERITPQRMFNELRLVLAESDPARVLVLLSAWGVLRALHPELHWNAALANQFAAAQTAAFHDADLDHVELALLLAPLSSAARAEISARFQPPAALQRIIGALDTAQQRLPDLRADALANSTLDRLLHGIGATALRALHLREGGIVAERIDHYLQVLRLTKTELNGDDVLRLGIAPGPAIGRVLAHLRAAKLDGLAPTRADEEAWLHQHCQQETSDL